MSLGQSSADIPLIYQPHSADVLGSGWSGDILVPVFFADAEQIAGGGIEDTTQKMYLSPSHVACCGESMAQSEANTRRLVGTNGNRSGQGVVRSTSRDQ